MGCRLTRIRKDHSVPTTVEGAAVLLPVGCHTALQPPARAEDEILVAALADRLPDRGDAQNLLEDHRQVNRLTVGHLHGTRFYVLPVVRPVSRYIPVSSDDLDEMARRANSRKRKTTSEKE